MKKHTITITAASLFLSAAAALAPSVAGAEPAPKKGRHMQSGKASWYGPGFHGRKTASGEVFNANKLTAAHRSLPFGTKVKVVNKRTGESVVVRINDRGPYAHGRIIDLSRASAQAIGITGIGVVDIIRL